jgi:hypothetical protein
MEDQYLTADDAAPAAAPVPDFGYDLSGQPVGQTAVAPKVLRAARRRSRIRRAAPLTQVMEYGTSYARSLAAAAARPAPVQQAPRRVVPQSLVRAEAADRCAA